MISFCLNRVERRRPPIYVKLLLLAMSLLLVSVSRAELSYEEAPRVVAVLEQGLAAESGVGLRRNPSLAIKFYCDAGTMGSSEGFFRLGRILSKGPRYLRNPTLGNAYLALAARLGHHRAAMLHDARVENAPLEQECGNFVNGLHIDRFDLEGYLSGLSPAKRKISRLIQSLAVGYGIDVRIALAIGLAESNLNSKAVSQANAQGVMQLIPATQERFGVKDPFDAESNIKGGLAYLKWLKARFGGDWELVAAAYNAGEGAVDRHDGVPPYRETRQYVKRVLFLAGFTMPEKG
ncbi:MAG: transglycosylase SLT domain-containing protein [Sulfuritalea sp.]|nr:transglycosylase SLT domain-containing protein [Sulfuritalea sp.]